jgi:hypothetical protein
MVALISISRQWPQVKTLLKRRERCSAGALCGADWRQLAAVYLGGE